MGAIMIATMTVLAIVLPDDWALSDRAGLVLMGAVFAAALHLLGRPRVVAAPDGVTVVNGIRTHVLVWPEIVAVTLQDGEPWPSLDLADGATLPMMGIQSADGARATADLAAFTELLRARGEGEEPTR
ncbi:PH domain-containing protein [Nocardiopsis coralliicola]